MLAKNPKNMKKQIMADRLRRKMKPQPGKFSGKRFSAANTKRFPKRKKMPKVGVKSPRTNKIQKIIIGKRQSFEKSL